MATEEEIKAEMRWLRCIDLNDDKAVRKAAIEIRKSIDKITCKEG